LFIYLIKNNSANQEFFLRCLFKQLFSSNSKKETLFTKPYEFDLAIKTFHYYYRIFHFVVIFLRLIDFHLMHFSIFWLNQLLILISFFFASHSSSNASLLFNHLFLFHLQLPMLFWNILSIFRLSLLKIFLNLNMLS
jgi:hypothetical protein